MKKPVTVPTKSSAFTIVELLVVIVVIGVLAAITIVSYAGITQKAIASALQSDLANAKTQLNMFQVVNGLYPGSITDCPIPAAGSLCITPSQGNSFGAYAFNNTSNPNTFRITANHDDVSYYINNESSSKISNSVGVLADGLIAHYTFDNNSLDYSSNNNTAIISGAVTDNGVINQSYLFDGVDDYLQAPATSYMNTLDSTLSFSFWIRSNDYSRYQSIISRRDGCNNDGLFNLRIYNKRLEFGYYTAPTTITMTSDQILINGNTYHIVWVKPFGQLGAKLYVNSSEQLVNNDSSINGKINSQLPLLIGAQWSYDACYVIPATAGQIRKFFYGMIDDVRIYNRALSQNEIDILYNL